MKDPAPSTCADWRVLSKGQQYRMGCAPHTFRFIEISCAFTHQLHRAQIFIVEDEEEGIEIMESIIEQPHGVLPTCYSGISYST